MRLFVIKAAFPKGARGLTPSLPAPSVSSQSQQRRKPLTPKEGGKCSQKETANLCLEVVAEAILNTPENALKINIVKLICCLFSKALFLS